MMESCKSESIPEELFRMALEKPSTAPFVVEQIKKYRIVLSHNVMLHATTRSWIDAKQTNDEIHDCDIILDQLESKVS